MKCKEIISCKDITKSYGTIKALSEVSISIEQGEAVSIVGANGAGKSTLFNVLLGLVRPEEGVCEILGVKTEEITPLIRENIGFIADHASPIVWASTNDIAMLYSSLYTRWNQNIFLENARCWQIDIYRRMNQLSKGQKRLAEIALKAAINPQILILDEPFNGLDSVMRIIIQRLLKKMQNQNQTTIVYATHILSELSCVADRMIVLRLGKKIFDQKLLDLSEKPEEIFSRLYDNELNGNS